MLSRILGHSARKTAARLCFSGSSSSSSCSRNRIGAIAWASTTTTERCLALNTTTAIATTTTTTTTTTGSSVRVMSTAATAAAQQSPPPPPPVAMFCRQCEQTQNHTACVTVGVCGKTSETAAVQDALMRAVQSLSAWTVAARNAGLSTDSLQTANELILQGAFSTMTNVNFSEARICNYIQQLETIKAQLQTQLQGTQHEPTERVAHNVNLRGLDFCALEEYGYTVSVPVRQQRMANDDAFALQELATYALKGVSAYASHCQQLGYMDDDIMNDIQKVWVQLSRNDNADNDSAAADVDGLLATVLHVGEINARVMAQLDQAHCEQMGEPTPTQYRSSAVKGKAILISGHDMADLHELLVQTNGTGVNVYTHGEMQPAHGYPKLKAFSHLAGNYGTAWQNQKFEFASFPGPIVITTNCVLPPRKIYQDRLYTLNEVGVDGVQHIENRNFAPVIEQAQQMKGFPQTIEPATYGTTGFNHRAVLPLAGQVIEAAKSGALSRIVVIGGCDGSQWERSYFTDLAEELPTDSLILTMGCAKNRVIHSAKLKDATLANGLPRVLDAGQCNDSYSAVVIAMELAKALKCGVNDLPLSLAISHLEQKAAAVLCTLLHLGIKNIRLGPSLPAYITPNILKILHDNYNLMPTGDVKTDIANMWQGK